MKGVYPVLFLSTALLLAACSEDKKVTEVAKVEPTAAAPATETAAPATAEQAAAPATEETAAPATTEQAAASATETAAPATTEQAAASATEETAAPATAEQATPAETASDLASLEQYLGKYPHDGVNFLMESPLAERLQALLGDDFSRFQENMATVGPLSKEGSRMFITGNKKSDGGNNAAALVLDPEQDALFVWALIDGTAKTFEENDLLIELPADVKTMIDNAKL